MRPLSSPVEYVLGSFPYVATAPTLPNTTLFMLNRHTEHITQSVLLRARYTASPNCQFRRSAENERSMHWYRSAQLSARVRAALNPPIPFASTPVAILDHYM